MVGEQEKNTDDLMELLGPRRGVDLKIQKALENFSGKGIGVLIILRENYELKYVELVKKLLNKGMKGVYVTTNKSASDLSEELSAKGADLSSMFFIDAITRTIGGKESPGENFSYVDSPRDLLEISIAIEDAVEGFKNSDKFIIIDSLTTLLVYNKKETIEKFVHSLSQKIREWKSIGLFLSMASTEESIINTLAQFCDTVATL